MIYFPSTKANISTEFAVASGSSIDAEGAALVVVATDGVLGVKPSTGTNADKFVGVAVSQQMPLARLTRAESFVQGSGDTVALAFTPSSGTVAVIDETDNALLVVTTDWTLAAKVITLEAATRGHTLTVHYAYEPTATQARAVQGDIVPGGPAGDALGQCGVIRNGIVFTDQYDTLIDWSAANPVIKTAANGLFTVGGSGQTLSNVTVLSAPTAGFPFLGLLIN
jgi:hypothetical protein